MTIQSILLVPLLLCAALPASAQQPGIKTLDFGIYEITLTETPELSATTDQAMNNVSEMRLISETTTIPKKLGTTFGYHYELTGIPEGEQRALSFELHHPDMITYQGDILRSSSFTQTVTAGGTFHDLFILEHDWELVDGEFTFKVYDGNQEISSITFQLR